MVRHVEYPGFRFWPLLKQKEAMVYRKTKHERKCERSILGNGHSYNNGREEPSKSSNRLTKVSEGIVSEKVSDLVSEIVQLAGFHKIQPKACYTAFTFGLKYRWA